MNVISDSVKIVMSYLPRLIRRQSTRQIWAMLVMVVFSTFLLESVFYFNKMTPDVTIQSKEGLKRTLLSTKGKLDIPKRPIQRLQKTSKWIIVFSQKGCDVTHFTRVRGWNVVVTGNKPKGCKSTKSCTYIDPTIEKTPGYHIIKHIKKGSGETKMIGYLFAISRGATVIYDVDCDVIPKFNRNEFKLSGNTSGLLFNGGQLFNPFSHFGFLMSPRGLPKTSQSVKGQGRYKILETRAPIIQQGLVNFKLGITSSRKSGNTDVTFDGVSPPAFISGQSFGPINSLNTIFLYDAFWALYLPSKAKGDSDIVRGYISQRLLDLINGVVGYVSPTAFTNSNDYYRFIARNQTSTYYEELIGALRKWKCVSKESFFKCATDLMDHLTGISILSRQDFKVFRAWIMDLKSIGYKEPSMTIAAPPVASNWNPQVVYNSPSVILSEMSLRNKHEKISTFNNSLSKVHKLCPKLNYTISKWTNPPITDIMLVVVLNYDFLIKSIPNMEFIHRIYFKHILYCGPDFKGLSQLLKLTNMRHIMYVNGVDQWFFTYQCIVHAANMNLNVKGYLYIGDDVLLNTWNIVNLPRDKFWMTTSNPPISRSQVKHPWWYYWKKPIGREAVNKFMDEVLLEAKKNPSDTMLRNFLRMYDHNINISRALHSSIDIFYAPAIHKKEIIRFGKIFRRHKTLLGLVVPMLRVGLVGMNDFVVIKGRSLWKKDREKNTNSFNEDSLYLHPFKMIKDVSEEHGRRFFCDTYMELAIGHLKKIRKKPAKKKRVKRS